MYCNNFVNNKKGYGFIQKASDNKDLFVHYSAITMDGYKTLQTGDEVEFSETNGDKGPQAADVRVTKKSKVVETAEVA